METKYYVDETGAYLGGFSGGVPEDPMAVEVPSPPDDGRQVWDSTAQTWGAVPDSVLAEQVRAERDRRIDVVMWRVERYQRQVRLGLTPTDDISALDAYIQALCDVPGQENFPGSVTWPKAQK